MSHDLSQHPFVKQLEVTNANLAEQKHKSDLPMSSATRKQIGLDPEDLRNTCKNEHLPTHDYHVGQDVMYQDAMSKRWYPATITSLCQEPRSYNVTTRECVNYRKTQAHLNPYQQLSNNSENEHSLLQSSDMQTVQNHTWTVKQSNCKIFKSDNNQVESYSRPNSNIKPPVKLET